MNSNLIRRSAELYGVLPAHLSPLHGGHFNQVYTFSRDEHEYILRITPPSDEINLPSMQSILDWMNYLSNHGASIAGPIPSLNGCLVEQLDQDGQSFIITAFEKARGILAEELPVDQWDETLFQNLGMTVGRMHAIARGYLPRQGLLRRPEWDQIDNCNHCHIVLDSNAPIQEKREQVRQTVRSLPKDPGSYGLIHGDLHCANLFVNPMDHSFTLFDFDDCCYGWYAMDIAMSLFDLLVLYRGADRTNFANRFLESYLKGYLPENHLDRFWVEQLPLFMKLLEVEIYAMLAEDHPAGETASWGDRFMAGRARRIKNDVPYIEIDFLEIYHQVTHRS